LAREGPRWRETRLSGNPGSRPFQALRPRFVCKATLKTVFLSSRALLKDPCTCVLARDCPMWEETRLSGIPEFLAMSAIASFVRVQGNNQSCFPQFACSFERFMHVCVGVGRSNVGRNTALSGNPKFPAMSAIAFGSHANLCSGQGQAIARPKGGPPCCSVPVPSTRWAASGASPSLKTSCACLYKDKLTHAHVRMCASQ
jgi:hypothetical protein